VVTAAVKGLVSDDIRNTIGQRITQVQAFLEHIVQNPLKFAIRMAIVDWLAVPRIKFLYID
jgi:hypothetical protein